MKEELKGTYELLVTEVASGNQRSLQAHYAIGFKELITYRSNGVEWAIVYWDWT